MDVSSNIIESSITVTCQKPKLGLETPNTSKFPDAAFRTYPSELSALSASARSPYPGFGDFIKLEHGVKTPITPPLAYTDFLKARTPIGDRHFDLLTPTSAPLLPTPSSLSTSTTSTIPSTTTSPGESDRSCNCDSHKSQSQSPTSSTIPAKTRLPSSAPGSARLERLRMPASPAAEGTDLAVSANSLVSSSSSFIGRATHCTKDYFDVKVLQTGNGRVRHVREVTTRTVTYTPRMSAAPKGKRRKTSNGGNRPVQEGDEDDPRCSESL